MWSKLKTFIWRVFQGGAFFVLPIALIVSLYNWLWTKTTDILKPITNIVVNMLELNETLAAITVIFSVLSLCAILGVLVSTTVGSVTNQLLQSHFFERWPLYKMLRGMLKPLIGNSEDGALFDTPAMAEVQVDEVSTLAPGFVTSDYKGRTGHRSAFYVPTSPNPTSGFIFYPAKKRITPIDVEASELISVVVACGAGSEVLLEAYDRAVLDEDIEVSED